MKIVRSRVKSSYAMQTRRYHSAPEGSLSKYYYYKPLCLVHRWIYRFTLSILLVIGNKDSSTLLQLERKSPRCTYEKKQASYVFILLFFKKTKHTKTVLCVCLIQQWIDIIWYCCWILRRRKKNDLFALLLQVWATKNKFPGEMEARTSQCTWFLYQ
jgi:hypothetical protein